MTDAQNGAQNKRFDLYVAAVKVVEIWDSDATNDDWESDMENAIEWLREAVALAGKVSV